MKKEKLIEEDYPLVKSRKKKKSDSLLYEYPAAITRTGSDDWIWQGYVVASNRKEAQKLLDLYIERKLSIFHPRTYIGELSPFNADTRVSKRQHGVYGI